MSTILIESNSISKIYDQDLFLKRGVNFHALERVDFVLQEGDFIAIMGPSGSGKSTLLNCLSTLDTPSKGSVSIRGVRASTMNDKALSDFRYHELGFIFQNHNLIPTLSIFDNIATTLYLGKMDPKEIYERVLDTAKSLDIVNLLEKKPNECSGGQRQRAAIARALVNKPSILICDEPTGNLDSVSSHELLELLVSLNKAGTSIVLVSHDSMIASYAKKLIYLRDGQIHHTIHRNQSSQEEFFQQISVVANKDSVARFFSKTSTPIVEKEDNATNLTVETHDVSQILEGKFPVYLLFNDDEQEFANSSGHSVLKLTEDTFVYKKFDLEIKLEDIKKINIFIESKMFFSIFAEFRYFVTLDLYTKDKKYSFFLNNENDLSPFFVLIKGKEIEDPIDVITIYQHHPDRLNRLRYFQSHRKELVNKYGIK